MKQTSSTLASRAWAQQLPAFQFANMPRFMRRVPFGKTAMKPALSHFEMRPYRTSFAWYSISPPPPCSATSTAAGLVAS